MLKICDVAVTIRFVMVRHRKPYSVFLVKYGLLCSKAGKGPAATFRQEIRE